MISCISLQVTKIHLRVKCKLRTMKCAKISGRKSFDEILHITFFSHLGLV